MAWRLGLRAIFLACGLSYCIAPVNSFTLDQNNAFRNYWRQYRSRTPLDYSRQYVEPLRFGRDPVLRNPYSATEQNLNVWPWNLSPRNRVLRNQDTNHRRTLGHGRKKAKSDAKIIGSSRICHPGPPKKPNPKYKNCLIIGDSISLGYRAPVISLLSGICQVQHAPFSSGSGAMDSRYGLQCLPMMLRTTDLERTHYDAVVFNFGLHDVNYSGRFPEEYVPMEEYRKNLEKIKASLLSSGTKIAFVLTTPVPSSTRMNNRVILYNQIAKSVMLSGHRTAVIDLYSVVTKICGTPPYSYWRCSLMRKPKDVHYTVKGYKLLGERVAAGFKRLLTQQDDTFWGQTPVDHYKVNADQVPWRYNSFYCPDKKTRCPFDTTCCPSRFSLTGYGCCMSPGAVACADKWHCCERGFRCSDTCSPTKCTCLSNKDVQNASASDTSLLEKQSHAHASHFKEMMEASAKHLHPKINLASPTAAATVKMELDDVALHHAKVIFKTQPNGHTNAGSDGSRACLSGSKEQPCVSPERDSMKELLRIIQAGHTHKVTKALLKEEVLKLYNSIYDQEDQHASETGVAKLLGSKSAATNAKTSHRAESGRNTGETQLNEGGTSPTKAKPVSPITEKKSKDKERNMKATKTVFNSRENHESFSSVSSVKTSDRTNTSQLGQLTKLKNSDAYKEGGKIRNNHKTSSQLNQETRKAKGQLGNSKSSSAIMGEFAGHNSERIAAKGSRIDIKGKHRKEYSNLKKEKELLLQNEGKGMEHSQSNHSSVLSKKKIELLKLNRNLNQTKAGEHNQSVNLDIFTKTGRNISQYPHALKQQLLKEFNSKNKLSGSNGYRTRAKEKQIIFTENSLAENISIKVKDDGGKKTEINEDPQSNIILNSTIPSNNTVSKVKKTAKAYKYDDSENSLPTNITTSNVEELEQLNAKQGINSSNTRQGKPNETVLGMGKKLYNQTEPTDDKNENLMYGAQTLFNNKGHVDKSNNALSNEDVEESFSASGANSFSPELALPQKPTLSPHHTNGPITKPQHLNEFSGDVPGPQVHLRDTGIEGYSGGEVTSNFKISKESWTIGESSGLANERNKLYNSGIEKSKNFEASGEGSSLDTDRNDYRKLEINRNGLPSRNTISSWSDDSYEGKRREFSHTKVILGQKANAEYESSAESSTDFIVHGEDEADESGENVYETSNADFDDVHHFEEILHKGPESDKHETFMLRNPVSIISGEGSSIETENHLSQSNSGLQSGNEFPKRNGKTLAVMNQNLEDSDDIDNSIQEALMAEELTEEDSGSGREALMAENDASGYNSRDVSNVRFSQIPKVTSLNRIVSVKPITDGVVDFKQQRGSGLEINNDTNIQLLRTGSSDHKNVRKYIGKENVTFSRNLNATTVKGNNSVWSSEDNDNPLFRYMHKTSLSKNKEGNSSSYKLSMDDFEASDNILVKMDLGQDTSSSHKREQAVSVTRKKEIHPTIERISQESGDRKESLTPLQSDFEKTNTVKDQISGEPELDFVDGGDDDIMRFAAMDNHEKQAKDRFSKANDEQIDFDSSFPSSDGATTGSEIDSNTNDISYDPFVDLNSQNSEELLYQN